MMVTQLRNSGIGHFWRAIQALEAEVLERQYDLLEHVASLMSEAIQLGRRIFVFGTGHSHMLAEEGHFRAGGLAPVVPILHSNLMLHENARLAVTLERVTGIAEPLLSSYDPQAGDLLFVFSNSGVNCVPVEMALAAKARGLIVVAVCALAYARAVQLSAAGRRLYEVADFVLDNGGEPGDSLIALEGLPWRVGPSSTIVGALLWNCLVTETAYQLQRSGAEVPLYASANLPGADEHNAALLKQWQPRNPHL